MCTYNPRNDVFLLNRWRYWIVESCSSFDRCEMFCKQSKMGLHLAKPKQHFSVYLFAYHSELSLNSRNLKKTVCKALCFIYKTFYIETTVKKCGWTNGLILYFGLSPLGSINLLSKVLLYSTDGVNVAWAPILSNHGSCQKMLVQWYETRKFSLYETDLKTR